MPCPDCGDEMISRQELIKISIEFLKYVAKNIHAINGSHPKRLLESMWMVGAGSGNMRGQNSQREIFDSERAFYIYDSQIKNKDSPEKSQLLEALKELDKFYEGMLLDFSSQLVVNWLKLQNPFSFEEPCISSLLDEFADVILDRKIVTKSLTIINGLNAASLPIDFEDGITIRQITNDELWMFGDISKLQFFPRSHHYHDPIPSETWKILEIKARHDIPEGIPEKR